LMGLSPECGQVLNAARGTGRAGRAAGLAAAPFRA
jgi:hypothetical protein